MISKRHSENVSVLSLFQKSFNKLSTKLKIKTNPKKLNKKLFQLTLSLLKCLYNLIESDLHTRYSLCVPSEEDQSPNFLKAEKTRL